MNKLHKNDNSQYVVESELSQRTNRDKILGQWMARRLQLTGIKAKNYASDIVKFGQQAWGSDENFVDLFEMEIKRAPDRKIMSRDNIRFLITSTTEYVRQHMTSGMTKNV